MPKPWENAEGYHDPTAYHGTKNKIRDEDEPRIMFFVPWYAVGL